MNKEYFLEVSNISIEAVKSKIIEDLNQRIGARQDCKVRIMPFDFRSIPALKAYWVMIDNIVAWDKGVNDLKKSYFHKEFMLEAKLYDEVDRMIYWKWKYKDKIQEGWEIYFWPDGNTYTLTKRKDKEKKQFEECLSLGRQYEKQIRSISNKGDVTKDEMSRLLMTVIDFGDKNIPGWVGIKDNELDNMLKHYKNDQESHNSDVVYR